MAIGEFTDCTILVQNPTVYIISSNQYRTVFQRVRELICTCLKVGLRIIDSMIHLTTTWNLRMILQTIQRRVVGYVWINTSHLNSYALALINDFTQIAKGVLTDAVSGGLHSLSVGFKRSSYSCPLREGKKLRRTFNFWLCSVTLLLDSHLDHDGDSLREERVAAQA